MPQADELEKTRDTMPEDTDLGDTNENSAIEEEEEEEETSEDESDDSDSEEDEGTDDDEQDEESDDSDDESDEDDDKPVTRKELREILKSNQNNRNAHRRVASKSDDTKGKPKPDDRLERIEQSQKKIELLERKRTFGYENQLSTKQVDHVFQLTKRPTPKFLKQAHVKAALDAIAAKDNVRSNTPSNSARHFKTPDGKEWKDLKPEEKQASFAERRRAILESRRA